MNKTLGFLSTNIEDSAQSKFIINTINALSDCAPYLDHVLFNSYYQILSQTPNRFATLHINEAKYFTGPLITFSLKDAVFLKQCISKQKIFFITEPEWLKAVHPSSENYETTQLMQYMTLRDIYVDSMDLLVTHNTNLQEIVSLCWKDSVFIDPNKYEQLYEHIQL